MSPRLIVLDAVDGADEAVEEDLADEVDAGEAEEQLDSIHPIPMPTCPVLHGWK